MLRRAEPATGYDRLELNGATVVKTMKWSVKQLLLQDQKAQQLRLLIYMLRLPHMRGVRGGERNRGSPFRKECMLAYGVGPMVRSLGQATNEYHTMHCFTPPTPRPPSLPPHDTPYPPPPRRNAVKILSEVEEYIENIVVEVRKQETSDYDPLPPPPSNLTAPLQILLLGR